MPQLQSTISTLDGQLKSSLSQWERARRSQGRTTVAKGEVGRGPWANMATVLNNLRGRDRRGRT